MKRYGPRLSARAPRAEGCVLRIDTNVAYRYACCVSICALRGDTNVAYRYEVAYQYALCVVIRMLRIYMHARVLKLSLSIKLHQGIWGVECTLAIIGTGGPVK